MSYAFGATAVIAAAFFFLWPQHQTTLFPRYESVRQAMLAGDLTRTRSAATQLASDARASQPRIAASAGTLAKSTSLDTARAQFAQLSNAMIAYRNASGEKPKPQVVYCSMEKRSWLQPKGEITNPYVDASMRGCGTITAQ